MPSPPVSPQPVAFETIAQEKVTGGWGEPIRRVIRDPATWEATWAELLPGRPQGETPPEVDFERSMVIAVAAATQHCDARITIREIEQRDGGLRVDLFDELADPELHCFAATRPFHAVRLPRHEGDCRFAVETAIYSPEPVAAARKDASATKPLPPSRVPRL